MEGRQLTRIYREPPVLAFCDKTLAVCAEAAQVSP